MTGVVTILTSHETLFHFSQSTPVSLTGAGSRARTELSSAESGWQSTGHPGLLAFEIIPRLRGQTRARFSCEVTRVTYRCHNVHRLFLPSSGHSSRQTLSGRPGSLGGRSGPFYPRFSAKGLVVISGFRRCERICFFECVLRSR